MTYAEGTTVSVEKSRLELERTLERYGADAFSYARDGDMAMVAFRAGGRMVKFTLPMPPLADFERTPGGKRTRTYEQQVVEREKAMRQRWRALNLVVKAKLEAVEAGISDFESEFLANVVLPNGESVGSWMAPQVQAAYESGEMPKLLGSGA